MPEVVTDAIDEAGRSHLKHVAQRTEGAASDYLPKEVALQMAALQRSGDLLTGGHCAVSVSTQRL